MKKVLIIILSSLFITSCNNDKILKKEIVEIFIEGEYKTDFRNCKMYVFKEGNITEEILLCGNYFSIIIGKKYKFLKTTYLNGSEKEYKYTFLKQ